MIKTKEGNEVFPLNCNIRKTMELNGNTLCATCKNAADNCKTIKKKQRKMNGYSVVIDCCG